MSDSTIESILQEKRLFPPNAEFANNATINSMEQYQQLYDRAAADPAAFWEELAKQELDCCLLYTSPSPRDRTRSRMPSSA